MFSPKVLDRAFTLEIRTATDELTADLGKPAPALDGDDHIQASRRLRRIRAGIWSTPIRMRRVHRSRSRNLHAGLSQSGDEFGHRVFYESLRFAAILAAMGERDADMAIDSSRSAQDPSSHSWIAPACRTGPSALAGFSETHPHRCTARQVTPRTAAERLPPPTREGRRMLTALQANQFVCRSVSDDVVLPPPVSMGNPPVISRSPDSSGARSATARRPHRGQRPARGRAPAQVQEAHHLSLRG